jgi:hypothetical protein
VAIGFITGARGGAWGASISINHRERERERLVESGESVTGRQSWDGTCCKREGSC